VKAIVYQHYGAPDVLVCADVEKPVPAANEVSIRVRAASANPLDWHFLRGEPYVMRMASGLREPRIKRLGADVAGEIEAVGADVTRFKPGDAVLGVCRGAFAEHACAAEAALVRKPPDVSFAQAAAVPVAAITALQVLRDEAGVQPGQRVLINGAAGGVGTFAVQIAGVLGADVTGVCSGRNVELVRSLEADHVIDYTRENFTDGSQRYDVLLDCVGNHSLAACRRVLSPKGAYVIVGGSGGPWLGPLPRSLAAAALSLFVSQRLSTVLAKGNAADLATLCDFIVAGKLRSIIDRQYELDEVPEAIRYLEAGHARGKVVIDVDRADET
jgi:NADPH:quinone reductase-like Zn-dependent oxidoreductase